MLCFLSLKNLSALSDPHPLHLPPEIYVLIQTNVQLPNFRSQLTLCKSALLTNNNDPFKTVVFKSRGVMEPKLTLLAARQGSKSRDGSLAQGIMSLIRKLAFMHWRRKWQPTPVFLPGGSQGREPGGLPSMGSHRVGHD